MAPSDEAEFMKFVLNSGDVWVVLSESETPEPKMQRSLTDQGETVVSFFNPTISSNLVLKPVSQKRYVVDRAQSSVVEFFRSVRRDRTLGRGRIWAEFTRLEKDTMTLTPKEAEFRRWYETMAGWIRRHYERFGPLTYVGPGAFQFRREGGEFE
jgi:hypothetical protein